MSEVGTVITVFRGGRKVVNGERVHELRPPGRHARAGAALALGDEVCFDPGRP